MGMKDRRCSRMQAWGYWYGGCRLVRENGYEEFGGYGRLKDGYACLIPMPE